MRRKLLGVGLIGAAGLTGCKSTGPQPAAADKPPLFGKAFGAPEGFQPKAPDPAPPAATAARPKKVAAPLGPNYEVALADAEVEAAFLEVYDQSGAGLVVGQEGGPKPEIAQAERDRLLAAGESRGLVPKHGPAERDRLIDSARQRYQRALTQAPANTGALSGLARLYAWTGDKERAVATLSEAARAYPKDHAVAHRLAGVQVQFGDFPGAEQSARQALALDPQNRTYQKTLAFALGHQGKWQEAGESLLAAGTPEADAHVFLAKVRIERGDADAGRKQLALALQASPQHPAALQAAADLDAGRQAPRLPPAADPVMAAGHAEAPR